MNLMQGEGKSRDEIVHDERHGGGWRAKCPFCRRDRAQAAAEKLVADGKLVRG